jgi:hypothetical protein
VALVVCLVCPIENLVFVEFEVANCHHIPCTRTLDPWQFQALVTLVLAQQATRSTTVPTAVTCPDSVTVHRVRVVEAPQLKQPEAGLCVGLLDVPDRLLARHTLAVTIHPFLQSTRETQGVQLTQLRVAHTAVCLS